MSCGIYKLNFAGTSKCYIGQSEDIQSRYKGHIRALNNGTASKKLYQAYLTFGMPTLEILIECDRTELNDLENHAIQVYDSVHNGFNTEHFAENVPILLGEQHPSSKYSNEQIINAFLLLVEGCLTHKEVAEKTSVSKNMVNHIAAGTCHRWLCAKFPEQYSLLLKNKPVAGSSKDRGLIYPQIVSPEGIKYNLDSLRNFSKEHDLPYTSLRNLVVGKVKHVRGWVLDSIGINSVADSISHM